ncbi:binding-protein-dependent transport systems inner membrane component [Thermodesulfatator indicus DSM 15286]|uniref:Binding-protein-dependent transport systems inner membrane component n=1 Tax=Thermodesulfatator indicus (strain DSM 15286 / JCM 11887 / CIR29812) TaxID=667014 RepID=F8AB63_THEID|nr:nickel ABC transporter permease [Thermodesulfatator indicus]AEH45519.1 binding-protein-dependent transport systems inner membrane component [Thermodesulfatator indicus DSM 15286]
MLIYLLKRLFIAVLVVVATSALTFFLLLASPGDTAEVIVKKILVGEEEYSPTKQEIEQVKDVFELNAPGVVLYLKWLSKAVHGDLGCSYVSGLPVTQEILTRLPATALLAITATLLSVIVAIPLGILSAARPNSFWDYACLTYSAFFISVPNFWLALILILFFSLYLDLLPVAGFGSLAHLILPAITLAAGMSAITVRLTRASLLDVLRQDYIITARAKGLAEKTILYRHALRNALIPVVTMIGLQIGHLLSGTVIVETVFGWPGIGKLLADSIEVRDIPMIQGCVVFIAIMFSLVNILVDFSYRFLDPRVKYGDESD